MTEQEREIHAKLNKAFPGGSLAVQDVSGGYSSGSRVAELSIALAQVDAGHSTQFR